MVKLQEYESQENTSNIVIEGDGSVRILESPAEHDRRIRRERIETIREKISDPNSDPSEISRMIAVELAVITGNMVAESGAIMNAAQLKAYSEQVKAFRELGKQLTDADVLSKKDILNFDGAKFAYVLEVIVNTFVQAMKEAGTPEDLRTSIMKHYRDIMQMNESKIRRDTARIDSNKSS